MSFRPIALAIGVTLTLGASLQAQAPAAEKPQERARTSVGVDVGYVSFADNTAPWKLGALSLGRSGSVGSLIARVTVAQRFGINGAQYEADAYPRLGGSTYAYLNAGHSSSSIFPEWRFGGELFTGLPRAFEASLGVRQLRFATDTVTLFTGSVGKYAGNYWLSLRPYLRSHDQAVTASASLTARRYFETAHDYVGARIGFGSTPSDRAILAELTRTSSMTAGVHGSRGLSDRLIGNWALDFEREQLDVVRTRNRWELNAGMRMDW